jgi:hypothetical protein
MNSASLSIEDILDEDSFEEILASISTKPSKPTLDSILVENDDKETNSSIFGTENKEPAQISTLQQMSVYQAQSRKVSRQNITNILNKQITQSSALLKTSAYYRMAMEGPDSSSVSCIKV